MERLGTHAAPQKKPARGWMIPMRTPLVLPFCIALVACDSGKPASTGPLNGSISRALQRGMTEQQVADVSRSRVPDRTVETTCGKETPKPFDCKVYIYDGALRAGQYDRKLTVVFENVSGRWIVTQWL
jgi:hypothetical protein